MNKKESAISHGIKDVRKYGITVLVALFLLNAVVLGALHWIESNQLRNELVNYMKTISAPDSVVQGETIRFPEEILSFHLKSSDRVGFYETSLGTGKNKQDYLAYADPERQHVLMKSEESIQEETKDFAVALLALYIGEIILLFGWWYFIHTKIHEIFDID